MMWLWIAGILCILLIVVLLSRIRLRILFNRQERNDDLLIEVHALFGIIRLRYAVPVLHFKGILTGIELKTEQINTNADDLIGNQHRNITIEKIKRAFHDIRLLLQHCFHFHEWLKACLAHVYCDRFVWKTSIGLGDAPETAISVGTVWGLKTSLLGYIFRFIRLEAEPKLQVMPMFNQTRFEMEAVVEAYIRMAFILVAGVQLLSRVLKVKDGWKTWRSVLQRASKRVV